MYQLSIEDWDIDSVAQLLKEDSQIELSAATKEAISNCYNFLHQKIAATDASFYGINTGFGSLCNIKVSNTQLTELQSNLVKSHACGMGDPIPPSIIKLILLLKIKNLSLGHSGVSLELVQRLVEMYNQGVLPVIFELGSLGASGDLAPLAHLSLPLIGMGEVYHKGERQAAKAVLQTLGWQPLQLQAKEGLALLNGTQFSTAFGLWSLIQSLRLSKLADLIAAMSIDAFACVLSPFDDKLHQLRGHKGQITTARNILKWLTDSAHAATPKETVQDPYAFRCVPQVHGASKDTINYVKGVLETEINSVTDNPNIFPEADAILSGGNFHAQPIALVLDYLAIAMAELGSISERRVYQLISGQRGLPSFLTPQSGLHSGLMITQYTAASIVSQNKQLCTPASVDSIVSCNGQEDHVSMAANAGTKLYRVVQNVERLLAIEWMAAAQALSFREEKSSPAIEKHLAAYRKIVPVMERDAFFGEDLQKTLQFLQTISL